MGNVTHFENAIESARSKLQTPLDELRRLAETFKERRRTLTVCAMYVALDNVMFAMEYVIERILLKNGESIVNRFHTVGQHARIKARELEKGAVTRHDASFPQNSRKDSSMLIIERAYQFIGLPSVGNAVILYAELMRFLDKNAAIDCHTAGYDALIVYRELWGYAADNRATPKKPILRNSDQYQCELNVCPTCGHIVEGERDGEPFAYCPQCGQRIRWEVV